jgi:hypothetical protein
MPSLLTALTAVERLAAQVNELPPHFAKALSEDLEYARFGAALPDLPCFGGWRSGLGMWFQRGEPAYFSRLFRGRAPVAFGLKAAELVSNGALVGTEPGLAFVAGYFTKLCVARALEPLLQVLLATHRKAGESAFRARVRINWAQGLALIQELHGSPLVGTPAIRAKLQIRKRSAISGISRGMYELVRVASQEAFGDAPGKPEVDSWMRGLHLYALALGSPLGRLRATDAMVAGARDLYRGPGIDVFAALDQALVRSRELLLLLGRMIRRNSFGPRSRRHFLEVFPEGAPEQVIRGLAV